MKLRVRIISECQPMHIAKQIECVRDGSGKNHLLTKILYNFDFGRECQHWMSEREKERARKKS